MVKNYDYNKRNKQLENNMSKDSIKPATFNNNESAVKVCSKCGTNLALDALFCHTCGKARNTEPRFCSYCGKFKLNDTIFCYNCGNSLNSPKDIQ